MGRPLFGRLTGISFAVLSLVALGPVPTDLLAHRPYVETTSERFIEFIVDRNTTENELKEIKDLLINKNVDFTYVLNRNDAGEIINISIQLTGIRADGSGYGSSYQSELRSNGIPDLHVRIDPKEGVVEITAKKHALPEKPHVISNEYELQRHVIKAKGKNIGERRTIVETVTVITDTDRESHIDYISDTNSDFFIAGNRDYEKPIYYFDGRKVTESDFKKLMPEEIKTIKILTKEEAVEKYGNEGKNGALEVVTLAGGDF